MKDVLHKLQSSISALPTHTGHSRLGFLDFLQRAPGHLILPKHKYRPRPLVKTLQAKFSALLPCVDVT